MLTKTSLKIIAIFVPHQGCPHTCIFCNQRQITGQTVISDGLSVAAQIKAQTATIVRSNAQRIEVAFYGGSFTAIPAALQEELLAPAYVALQQGMIDGIRLSTRPDYIDPEILSRLRSFGVSIIELGVQSMDDAVLRQAERGHTAADVVAASNLIKEFGCQLGIQLMTGLPGQTKASVCTTVAQVINLHPDFVRIYPVIVLPGTVLAQMYRDGSYQPPSLAETVEICAWMLQQFTTAGIPVIRLGLQASAELAGEKISAGPYHPAFRQLVEGLLYREAMNELIRQADVDKHSVVVFCVNGRDLSTAIGLNRENIAQLKVKWCLQELIIHGDNAIERGMLWLVSINGEPQELERAVLSI